MIINITIRHGQTDYTFTIIYNIIIIYDTTVKTKIDIVEK